MAKHRGKSKYGTVRYWIFHLNRSMHPLIFYAGKFGNCILHLSPCEDDSIISVLKAPQDNSPTCFLTWNTVFFPQKESSRHTDCNLISVFDNTLTRQLRHFKITEQLKSGQSKDPDIHAYSLVPIRRHVPINRHVSRHWTCTVPNNSHTWILWKV